MLLPDTKGGKKLAGKKIGSKLNWGLLNSVDYETHEGVKSLMVCYQLYERKMMQGDTVAASIWVDLKTAIYKPKLLTTKQMEVVELVCMHNMSITVVAEYLKLNHRAVGFRFDGAVVKVKKLLNENGELYRLYGDEFAIIFYGVLDSKDIEEYILALKKEKFEYKDGDFILDVTVGFANYCDGNILENANIALRSAKKRYKNIVCYDHSLAIAQEDSNHILWLKKLEIAIETDMIVPVFMSMKNTITQKIDKYETLVRLKDGETLHTPDKFLDVAYASGKYPLITQTIIKKSFEYFENREDLKFSINFSLSDIENSDTTTLLFETLKNYKNSKNVIIELLETEELNDFDLLNSFIQEVKKYDAHIAIDDFGSGYSNFNYLLNLDVDIVKLDSSLIENIFTNQESAVVVSNIVRISKELNFEVVAEKVTDQNIENILTIYGVDYLQGFYIGKPNIEILEEWQV